MAGSLATSARAAASISSAPALASRSALPRRAARHLQQREGRFRRDVRRGRHPARGVLGWRGGEDQAAAARADRRQQRSRPVRDQQQHAARRRLLQRLQDGVGGVGVEVVGRVDDGHPIGGAARRLGKERRQRPRLVHRDRLARLGVRVVALQHQQVGMGAAGDLPEHRIARVRTQQAKPGLGPRAQQSAGGAVGERRLADALGSHEQPGVVQASALQRLQEGALRAVVALEPRGVAGMDELGHQGASRLSTAAQIAASTASTGCAASITTQRSRSTRAMARNPSRSRAWKSAPFGLEAGLGVLAGGGARQASFHRQVEDQRQVGPRLAQHVALQRLDQRAGRAAAGALVGPGGVGEAVADHPVAGAPAPGRSCARCGRGARRTSTASR